MRVGLRLAVVLFCVLALHQPPSSTAAHCPPETNEFGEVVGAVFDCHRREQTDTGRSGTGVRYEPRDLIAAVSQVDGEPCRILATVTSAQGQDAVVLRELLRSLPVFGRPLHDVYQWLVSQLPGCPRAVPQPRELAWDLLQTAEPPHSEPFIAPGYAIAGKRAFLETRGATAGEQRFDTVLGPLSIRFEAQSLTLDWGDGSGLDAGPFTMPAEPYPDGHATHTYTDVGAYDVTVRTSWVAHWSVGGEAGTLDGLSRTERLEAFEVRQLQAVRDR